MWVERRAGERFLNEGFPAPAEETYLAPEVFLDGIAESRVWVATVNEAVIGFALAGTVNGKPHLEEVGVVPAHGRQGIGRALIQQVSQWALEDRHVQLTLTTFKEIPWNGPYYQKLGFRELAPHEIEGELFQMLSQERKTLCVPPKRIAMVLSLR